MFCWTEQPSLFSTVKVSSPDVCHYLGIWLIWVEGRCESHTLWASGRELKGPPGWPWSFG